MKNINAMEVICMRSKNKTKAGYGYYIDKTSIYIDEDGDAYGDCYNGKGEWIGRVLLSRFKTTIPNLIITIKEKDDEMHVNISNETQQLFLHGNCGVFALALNKEFGYSICILTEDDITRRSSEGEEISYQELCEYMVHCFCITPKFEYVDIRGITDNDEKYDSFFNEFSDFQNMEGYFYITSEYLKSYLINLIGKEDFEKIYKEATDIIHSSLLNFTKR